MRKLLSTIAVVLGFISSVYAQSPKDIGLRTITEQAARAHIEFLADDELQGREAGYPGGRIAAAYIQSRLKELGLKPFLGTTYEQPFQAYGEHYQLAGRWQVKPSEIERIKKQTHLCLSMKNILAVLPGQTDELVIVGAHYDHLGMQYGLVADSIYNGADDNASGVSAVLQIAKAFSLSGVVAKRTIVFAFWDGEEKGLLGSKYFVQSFSDLSRIKSYLNFDMIGRNNKPDQPKHVVYFYTESQPQFEQWLKEDLASYALDIEPEIKAWDKPITGSDNASFAQENIPIIWYHTDGHPDYHQPSDEPQYLNWEKVVAISKAAYLNVWKMAHEDY